MLSGLTSSKCRSFTPARPEAAESTKPEDVTPPKRGRARPKGTRNPKNSVPKWHDTVLGVRHVDHPAIPPALWISLAALMASFFRGLLRILEKLQVGASGREQEAILFTEVPKHMARTVCKLATWWWSYDNGYLAAVLTCDRCNADMPCKGPRPKFFTCLYGRVRCARAYYVCSNPACSVPLKKDPLRTRRYSIFPLDMRLGVDDNSFLPSVQEVVVWMTSMDPYGKCLELIKKLLSFSISHRTAWLLTQKIGDTVKARQDEAIAMAFSNPQAPVFPMPKVERSPDIGVVEIDGSFAPIERPQNGEVVEEEDDNPDAPPRPNKKDFQEVKAGLVAHLLPPVPKPRRASQPASTESLAVTSEGSVPPQSNPGKPKGAKRKVRPDGQEPTLDHKKLAVHLGQPLALFRMLLLLIYQLDLPRAKVILVIGDGARWIWAGVREHFNDLGPKIVEILDYWHAIEHLWKLANSAFGQGSTEAAAWVHQRESELLRGLPEGFFTALEALVEKTKGMGESIAKIGQEELRYFHNNESRMRYAEYLAAGYLIGSGAMEGTNNYHIKGRVDRSGMRWKPPGVMAVLRNRTLIGNGDWDDHWKAEADVRHRRHLQQVATLTSARVVG